MRLFICLFVLLFTCEFSKAQDFHYTQFYATPTTINPASTGLFDTKYRVSLQYRDQGRGVLEYPYRTFSGAFDLKFDGLSITQAKDYIGVGLLFYTDRMSGFEFNTTFMGISAAYHKALNAESNQYLSLGLQGGALQRGVLFDNFIFQDQFNGTTGFTFPTREQLPDNSRTVGDFSVGLQYVYAPAKSVSFTVGGAMQHIFAPRITFKELVNTTLTNFHRRYNIHLSSNIPLKYNQFLIPRLYAAAQGPHLETVASVQYKLGVGENSFLYFGPNLRMVKNTSTTSAFGLSDVSAMFGIEFNRINLNFSYDYSLKAYRTGLGAFEFSIIYSGNYENEDDFCPTF